MTNPYKKLSSINPKVGKGQSTRQIATGIWNALIKARLSGPEYQIVFFIINQTWGWGKDMDAISYGQFTTLTGLTRRGCIKIVQRLDTMHLIYINRQVVNGHSPLNSYGFNKHYDTWLTLSGEPLFTTQEVKLVNSYSLLNERKVVNRHTKSGEPQRHKVVNRSSHNNIKTIKRNKQKKITDSLFVQKLKKEMKHKKPLKLKNTSSKIPDI